MSRRTQLLVAIVFCAVLVAPAAMYAIGFDPRMIENRALTDYPEPDPTTLLDTDTYDQLARALVDRLPMRGHLVEFEAEARRKITFGGGGSDKVTIGRDGWLYLSDTLVNNCPGANTDEFLKQLDAVRSDAEFAGVDFLMSVVPDKVLIYPELRQPGLAGALGLSIAGDIQTEDSAACSRQWNDDIRSAAADREWLLTFFDAMQEAADSSGALQYWKHDTHWTAAGATHQTRATIDAIDAGLWNPDELTAGVDQTRIGDLARLLGHSTTEARPTVEIQRPGVRVLEQGGQAGPSESSIGRSWAKSEGPTEVIPGTTLMIGDSFGEQSWRQLQPYFEELIFLNRTYLDHNGLLDVLDGPPDRIIVEQVTRNLAKGWYSTTFSAVEDLLSSSR